jgi:hypothetical protein
MFNKRPLLYAGISGILLLVFSTFFSTLGLFIFPEFFSILNSVFSLVLSIFFFYGFYYLGLKYKSKLLSVISLVSIVLIVILYFGLFLFNGPITRDAEKFNLTYSQQQIVLDNLNMTNASVEQIAILEEEMAATLWEFITPYLVLIIITVTNSLFKC